MANNSAVVMPLNSCCLAGVVRSPADWDRDEERVFCSECGTLLMYSDRAWRKVGQMDAEYWNRFYEEAVRG